MGAAEAVTFVVAVAVVAVAGLVRAAVVLGTAGLAVFEEAVVTVFLAILRRSAHRIEL